MTIEQNLERVMEIGVELRDAEYSLMNNFQVIFDMGFILTDDMAQCIALWMEFNEIVKELKRDRTLQVIRASV